MQQEIVLEQAHVEDERTYHSFGAKQEEGLPPSANLLLCIASRTTALFCTLVHYQARSTVTYRYYVPGSELKYKTEQ